MTDPLIPAANEVEEDRALNVMRVAVMTDQFVAANELTRSQAKFFESRASLRFVGAGAGFTGVMLAMGWSIYWWVR